jgi:glycosyltransferase involved in cell wall biosynthesis
LTAKPIRVLTLIESATVTGPARNIIEFAKLARQPESDLPEVEVTLLTYKRGPEESALALAARDAGVPVITIDERRRWDLQVLPQLRRAIVQHNPDILETRNVKSHFFVRLLRMQNQYPWIAWNHGYTATSRLDSAYTQLDRWSLRGVHRMVTVCKPFADKLVSLGVPREKISIFHNAVKPFTPPSAEDIERVRAELALPRSRTPRDLGHPQTIADDETVILSVGRLSYEKNHADLLRAGAALAAAQNAPHFRIAIVGDGPERGPLQRLAQQLGIEKLVTFAGFQRQTAPYYALASVVGVPSHSEGSPNVVLEAMAAGLPVVANKVGGVPEILEETVTGLMVPEGDTAAMAHALKRVLESEELRDRLGSAARARALSDYTPDAYRRKLANFYARVLTGR